MAAFVMLINVGKCLKHKESRANTEALYCIQILYVSLLVTTINLHVVKRIVMHGAVPPLLLTSSWNEV